jgi:hypothetical protein
MVGRTAVVTIPFTASVLGEKEAGHRICDPPGEYSVGAITTRPDDALWLTGPVSGKSCGLRPKERLPNSLLPIPMPSRGASRRGQTVPCGLQKPVAFANKVRAAS